MAGGYGWRINGHHYHVCESVRMGRALTTYFRDGKRVSKVEFFRLRAEDQKKEKAAEKAA